MQNDVTAATKFVEEEVRRLLSGNCEAWEMVMTVCVFGLTTAVQMLPLTNQFHRYVLATAPKIMLRSFLRLCMRSHCLGLLCL